MAGRGQGGAGRGPGGGRGMGAGRGPSQGRGAGPGSGQGRGAGRGMGGGRGAGLRRRDGSCAAPPGAAPSGAQLRSVAVVARPEDCTACGSCVDVCPRDAITVDDVAKIDEERCNGCEACVTECPNGVFELTET